MASEEILELLEFIDPYLVQGTKNLNTLNSLVSEIDKNKSKVLDDYVLIETGMMIIAHFVFLSKLEIITESYNHLETQSKLSQLINDFENLLNNSYEILDMNPALIPQMQEMTNIRFSRPSGFEDAELFLLSVENIDKNGIDISALSKNWRGLILF